MPVFKTVFKALKAVLHDSRICCAIARINYPRPINSRVNKSQVNRLRLGLPTGLDGPGDGLTLGEVDGLMGDGVAAL
jgi:hypothetical protein